jgi:2-polyprenyl-3-methyl-5-hydroxy-6-metoxy-1,4-benzoquinol methylase
MSPEEFHSAHPEKTFDVVTFFEVLEHQDDPQGFLNIAQGCLANGDTSP